METKVSFFNEIAEFCRRKKINYKIREHSLSKVPLLLICGEKEVKAKREGEIVRVVLADEPNHIKFLRATQEKRHKKVAKKKEEPKAEEKKEKTEEKTEEEKKEEKEKEKSGEQAQLKVAEQAVKAEKHMAKGSGPQIQRKALKK